MMKFIRHAGSTRNLQPERSTPTTMSKQNSTFDFVEATFDFVEMTKFHTQNSFDIIAVFSSKVERWFDIVAGVDRV